MDQGEALAALMEATGLDVYAIEQLVRLAAAVASGDTYEQALRSFSDPIEVVQYARTAMRRLYGEGRVNQ